METTKFTWIPFYTELAHKLLEYKDNREPLVEFVNSLEEHSKYIKKADGSRENDIDPFTFFAIFNRQITWEKRKFIAQEIKQHFNISANIPNDFNAIPVVNNLKSTFFSREDIEKRVPILWQLFESAINNDNEKFITSFDKTIKYDGIKWNITIGLFWVNPQRFMPLDGNSREYLKSKYIPVLKESQLTGDNFLKLNDEIQRKIQNGEIEHGNNLEISWAAWEKSNEQFTWIPFIEELSQKLLEYKNNRQPLVDAFIELTGGNHYKSMQNIDPYTFLSLFLRFYKNKNRIDKISKYIKEMFGINANIPNDYIGLPWQVNNFYNVSAKVEEQNKQIDTLWNLFEAQMNVDVEGVEKYFDEVMQFSWRMITLGLYMVNPQQYMSLDGGSIKVLNKYSIKRNINDIASGNGTYQKYCQINEEIKQKIESSELKEKSFPEIVQNGSKYKIENDERKYFLAGFSFGGSSSQLDRFKAEGVWEGSGNDKVNNLIMSIKPNDILILKTSSTKGEKHDLPFIRIHAVGIVESEVEKIENSEHYRCRVNYIEMPETKDFDDNKYGAYRQTLHECNDREVVDYVNQLFAMDTTTAPTPNHIDKYAQILRHKKNLILQGAPGTGKTYNTAALALSICEVTDVDLKDHDAVMQRYKQLQKEGRIGFCTFHQSMDYEDFVEGIKPSTENQTVSYDVEDGIFKQIADRARENWEENKENGDIIIEKKHRTIDVLNGLCEKIQREIDENSYADLFLNNKSKMKIFEIFTKHDKIKTIRLKNSTVPTETHIQGLSIEIILRDYEPYTRGEIKTYKDIKPTYESKQGYHGNAIYYFELFKKMHEFEKTMEMPQTNYQKPNKQNYVLIIDEINRGNVSRIFGELITLLEADKRLGGDHPSDHPIEVTLPYSKERFGVPKNLYIIGTMNTTDRSVGNIDYAVRRRFAFATLESQRELVEQHSTEQAVRLYDAVRKFIEKSKAEMDFEDLMVGHSYFFVKSDEHVDSDEQLEMRWQYEIKPLLNEYIKDGLLNAETIKTDVTVAGFVENKSNQTQE